MCLSANFYDLLRSIQRQVQKIERVASQQDFIRSIVADHLDKRKALCTDTHIDKVRFHGTGFPPLAAQTLDIEAIDARLPETIRQR